MNASWDGGVSCTIYGSLCPCSLSTLQCEETELRKAFEDCEGMTDVSIPVKPGRLLFFLFISENSPPSYVMDRLILYLLPVVFSF